MTVSLRRLILALAPAVLVAGLFLGTGCDTDSASSAIEVSPSSVVMSKGESADFTASGGYEYTWSLDPDDGSGRLDTFKGPTVTYTCLNTNGDSPKKIVVTSTIEGSSTGSSSSSTTSAYKVQGFAEIFYPGGTSDSSASTLSINASSATIATNTTRNFNVVGGTPPYRWEVSSPGVGTCSPASPLTGDTTTYTALHAGSNTLTCRDSSAPVQRSEVAITTP